jgi:predicted ferric reductase
MLAQFTLTSISQIAALIGLVLMSVNIVLTTRFKIVEKFLGGLDSVYYSHQILGSTAFLLILTHPLMMVIRSLPNFRTASIYLIPGSDIIYDLGIYAVYIMISAFIFIVFIKLPYHLWKLTHQFMALTFLLGGVHALLGANDISVYLPLKIFIGFFVVVGSVAAFYSIFLYKKLGPKFLYEVSRVKRLANVFNIYFKPLRKRRLEFLPGQFVFIEFENEKVGNELHPFSISSAPHEAELRVSAKAVGDYTARLENVKEGDKVFLYGPYGAFGKAREDKNVLWIAGGIGVTPFLNMLRAESKDPKHKRIYFFNSYRTSDEAIFNEEISSLKKELPNLKYFDWATYKNKRLTVEKIKALVDMNEIDTIYCCGPTLMMESLKEQFIAAGYPKEKFVYEDFSLNS